MFPSNQFGGYAPAYPSMNPSPYQFPQPSQFGGTGMPGMGATPVQTVQQVQPQQAGPDWVSAPTIKQVEQVSVQPGGKAWVMVQNEPVFALRVADNMGLVTTDYYRFEKIDPAATGAQNAAPAGDYITRQEAEQMIAERLNALAGNLRPPASKSAKKEAAE